MPNPIAAGTGTAATTAAWPGSIADAAADLATSLLVAVEPPLGAPGDLVLTELGPTRPLSPERADAATPATLK
jgi:hypothetical protein